MRRLGGALGLAVLLGGCTSVRYLSQAARGQASLLVHARPLAKVIADPKTPPEVRQALLELASIRRFGAQQGLTATKSYQRFVQLDRPAVVWVVSASPPLKLEAKTWRFPLVGSVPYLGWFAKQDAVAYGQELAAEGMDVDVRGASAYSTLGWFRDPLLSSMLPREGDGIGSLANVVLHESVHATVYVPGESGFNESLASFAADRMTPEYLAQTRGPHAPEVDAYAAELADEAGRIARLQATYAALERLYASDRSDDAKRAEKRLILDEVQTALHLARPLNNAALLQFRTYNTGGDAFERLLTACGGDWRRFFGLLRGLDEKAFAQANGDVGAVLAPLAASQSR